MLSWYDAQFGSRIASHTGAVHRVGEDLRREHARLSRNTGDVPGLRTEEPLDNRVDEGPVLRGCCGFYERIELGIEASEQVGVEQVFDDDGAVGFERVDDALRGRIRRDSLESHPRMRGAQASTGVRAVAGAWRTSLSSSALVQHANSRVTPFGSLKYIERMNTSLSSVAAS